MNAALKSVSLSKQGHEYLAEENGRSVLIRDRNMNGAFDEGDTIETECPREGSKQCQEEAFKKYKDFAREAIAQFRKELPAVLKKSNEKVAAVEAQAPWGMMAIRENAGVRITDFKRDGKADFAEFDMDMGGSKVEVKIAACDIEIFDIKDKKGNRSYSLRIDLDLTRRGVEEFLRVFDQKKVD